MAKVPFAIFFKKTIDLEDKANVTLICIDDFAFKKGRRYGTLMVDIGTNCIIDMLESRKSDDVAKWLMKYPNIQLVVRDGSTEYATAITKAHPTAIQVNDRFHIIKNLTEYAKQAIKKAIPSSFRIATAVNAQSGDGSCCEKFECHGDNLPEESSITPIEKKQARVEQVRSLAEKGFSVTDIVKEVELSRGTVKKYLNPKFVVENRFEPHLTKINAMLQNRSKFKEIEAAIREDGYSGSASTLQKYITEQRKKKKTENEDTTRNTEVIERKDIVALLYHPVEDMKNITPEQVEKIIHEYPAIGRIFEIVTSFKNIMATKQENMLESWIKTALQMGIQEINSFVNGVTRDLKAVKNAIALKYNNGLAEGSVNKLKLIKRIMYGRCKFTLLRNKVLMRELGGGSN